MYINKDCILGNRKQILIRQHKKMYRIFTCPLTHSNLSFLLCEVGGDVSQSSSCTGPDKNTARVNT